MLCVKNEGYPASLEVRKIYRVMVDPDATRRGLVRVVDESGEDYLYPKSYFIRITLPKAAEKVFPAATRAGRRVEAMVREGVARWRGGKPRGARRPP